MGGFSIDAALLQGRLRWLMTWTALRRNVPPSTSVQKNACTQSIENKQFKGNHMASFSGFFSRTIVLPPLSHAKNLNT